MNRIVKMTVGFAVLLGGLLFGGNAAFGGSPEGGAVQLFSTPTGSGGGTIVLTGAVGDSGTVASADSSGMPNPKGQYKLFTLSKGTILINTKKLNGDLNNPNRPPTTFNMKTCSGTFVVTDPVPVVKGTAAYVGINGMLSVTVTFALVFPLQHGTCNLSNSGPGPVAQYGSVAGHGSVSFESHD